MYMRGRLTIELVGTGIKLTPPRNFFGGVAHLLTKGRWETREAMETYKLLSFAQSANRALMDMGVRDVARVSIAGDVVYEDLRNNTDDFDAAMQALKEKLSQGLEPDPHSDFDLVLKHDDGVLTYVIDLDFVREHPLGMDPVAIVVTAVPSDLRRRTGESDDAYHDRISAYFLDQVSVDGWQARWEARLEGFLNQLADHFRTTLGIMDVHIETRTIMPRRRDADALGTYTSFGYPLYGYDPTLDLAYLMMWDTIWAEHQLRMRNIYYGDYGSPYIFIDDGGWGYDDAYQYDATHPAPMPIDGGAWSGGSDSGGGGWLNNASDFSSDSGGGGSLASGDAASGGSDSGGGGWLSNIGDFSSDSGGGGDIGGSSDSGGSSCGGGSSCSSCGGGGCSS
jgi:hypothetical protein